jgi:signal transduction histidine kinase
MEKAGIITISIMEQEAFVYVRIQDTSSSMLEDDQSFIFERFYRGENKKYAV